MTKSKPSDVVGRMRAAAAREKPATTLPELSYEDPRTSPQDQNSEDRSSANANLPSGIAAQPVVSARGRRVRFTLDLEPEAHKRLKRFALEADADASEVLRALLDLLDTDVHTRNAVLDAISKDMP